MVAFDQDEITPAAGEPSPGLLDRLPLDVDGVDPPSGTGQLDQLLRIATTAAGGIDGHIPRL